MSEEIPTQTAVPVSVAGLDNPQTDRSDAMELLGKIPIPGAASQGLPPVPPAPQPPAPPPSPSAPQPAAPAKIPDYKSLGNRYNGAAEPVQPPVSVDTVPETPPVDPATGKPDVKTGHAFAELRAGMRRYEKEIVPGLEAKAKAAEDKALAAEAKAAALLAEKEKVEREKGELSEKVGRLSLTESQAFREKYGAREAKVKSTLAQTLVKFARVEPANAEAAAAKFLSVGADPKALDEATGELHPAVAGAVLLAAQEWAAIGEERNQEIANWRQSALANGVTEAREEVIRSAEERRRLALSALDFVKKAGNPVFADDGSDPEAAGRLAEIEDAFQGWMQSASDDELSKAAAEGFVAPFLYRHIADLEGEVAQLRAHIQGYRHAAGIPVSPSAPAVSAPPPPKPAEGGAVPVDRSDDPMSWLRDKAAGLVSGYNRAVAGQQV